MKGLLLASPLIVFLVVILVYPIARLATLIDVKTLDHVAWIALRNSLGLSLLVAVVSVAICIAPAWALARSRGNKATRIALTLPMTFSGVVVGLLVLATVHVYGFVGLLIGYLYFEIPRATLALEAAFRQIDPSIDAAAATLGARPFARLTRLIVPMTMPSIASVLLLTFSVSLGSYGVALMLSRRFAIVPLEIYAAFTTMDDARSATLSLVLLLVAIAVGALRRWR
jgi:putative spermidine/putrescine transport system permease protein